MIANVGQGLLTFPCIASIQIINKPCNNYASVLNSCSQTTASAKRAYENSIPLNPKCHNFSYPVFGHLSDIIIYIL